MKKLFLILAATVACSVYANSASAQTDYNLWLSGFYFDSVYQDSDNGYRIRMNIKQVMNPQDPYPGRTTEGLLNAVLSQPGVRNVVRLDFIYIWGREGIYDIGCVELTVIPSRYSHKANLHFTNLYNQPDRTIRNY